MAWHGSQQIFSGQSADRTSQGAGQQQLSRPALALIRAQRRQATALATPHTSPTTAQRQHDGPMMRTCCASWLTCRLLSSSMAGTLRRLSPPLPTPARAGMNASYNEMRAQDEPAIAHACGPNARHRSAQARTQPGARRQAGEAAQQRAPKPCEPHHEHSCVCCAPLHAGPPHHAAWNPAARPASSNARSRGARAHPHSRTAAGQGRGCAGRCRA